MKIKLEKMINARDLGGIVTSDGYRIKEHRLIRSEALGNGSANDLKTLREVYGLSTVVDFRNLDEIKANPDPEIEGVTNHWLPIFEEKVDQITFEGDWDRNDPLGMYFFFKQRAEAENDAFQEGGFYKAFAADEHSVNEYKKFFEILLKQESGSVLWHCSAGKDRAGTGAAYVLLALGVDKETVICDYLCSNESYQPLIDKHLTYADERGLGEDIKEFIRMCNGVREEYLQLVLDYIDKQYGDFDTFLEKKLGVDSNKRAKLRELYLDIC